MSGIRKIHFTDHGAGIIFTLQRGMRHSAAYQNDTNSNQQINTGGNDMAVGIGVFAVSAILSYEIEKRLPSVKKN